MSTRPLALRSAASRAPSSLGATAPPVAEQGAGIRPAALPAFLLLAMLACSPSRGEALFQGPAPLVGTIVGHDAPLPAEASRCVNCHAAGSAPGGDDAGESFGPSLHRSALMVASPRRGGPATRYDAAGFCRLLRTGVDPGDIIIARAMPRYALADADCAALWSHLVGVGP